MQRNSSGENLSDCQWLADVSSKGLALADHLAQHLLISREEAVDLIDFGSVQVRDRQERNPSRLLEGSENIRVCWPWNGTRRFYEIDPQRILYHDRYLVAYDKEAGIPSQQTPSDGYNNLFAALGRYFQKTGAADPYIAMHHRLDMETSGVMVFALDRSVNLRVGEAFQHHRVVKDYLAWVEGAVSIEEWTSTEDITRKNGRYATCPRGKGKSAETFFRLIRREKARSLVLARPRTGRTHQIRLHLAACGHPVLGDVRYGAKPAPRLFLHAHRLSLPHPVVRKTLLFIAPIPSDWPAVTAELSQDILH